MRLPQRPAAVTLELLTRAYAAAGGKAEAQRFIERANAEYHHWDELRARPVPSGMSKEQAWALVKMSRIVSRRTLPLVDPSGRPFSYWLPSRAIETLHTVDRWGGNTLALDRDATLLQSIREQVVVSSLMEEAIATSQIEGAATTRKVAKEMLRTKRSPRDRGEQMIANSYDTIELLRTQRQRPLSIDFLFEIQARMTRDTLDDTSGAGRFRIASDDVSVIDVRNDAVIFTPPPADLLPERIAKLVEYANAPPAEGEFTHPLVKAAILHFWLAYEHPFIDGNGRTARALFYWFMLRNDYWLFEFLTVSRAIMKSPARYYRSFLFSEHDDGDLTYSLMYQLDATKAALGSLREYLRHKQEQQRMMVRTLRAVPDLNHRQRELLDYAVNHPDASVTFQSHQRSQGITYVTARSDILDLVRRKLLAATVQGKQRAFFAADDLAERLARPPRRKR